MLAEKISSRITVEDVLKDIDVFIGRHAQIHEFINILNSPRDIMPCICVVQLYGLGGIGKTSILNEYRRICINRNYPCVSVNIRIQRGSVIDFLTTFRDQFNESVENAQAHFREFDNNLRRKRDIEKKLTSASSQKKDLASHSASEAMIEMGAAATGATVGSLLGPLGAVVGGGFGAAAGKAIMESFGEKLISELISKGLSPQDAKFQANSDKFLSQMFVDGVNDIADQAGRVVLILDTYEEVPPIIDEWLREQIIKKLQTKVIVVIGGRDKVTEQDDNWIKFSRILKMIEVRKFSPEDVHSYLSIHNIHDDELIKQILIFTDSLPWALALLMDMWKEGMRFNPDDLEEGSIRHLVGHRVVKRFLNQIEGTELSKIIDVCTVARRFDEGLLRHILENDEHLKERLENLRLYSFVRVLADGSLSLHDIVREFMLQDLKGRDWEKYKEFSNKLAIYYQDKLRLESSFDIRKRCMIELLYHTLHSNEKDGIDLFRRTVSELDMYTQFDLRDALLNEITLFRFEEEENISWQAYCLGYRAVNQGKWMLAEKNLLTVKNALRIPELLRCLSYDTLGELYMGQGHYSSAIEIFEKSLSLKENLPTSIGLSGKGQTLSKLAECNAIIGKYKNAEEYAATILASIQGNNNKTTKAWALKSLGDTYRLWGKTKQSIHHFEEALSIFQDVKDDYAIAHVCTQLGRVYLHDGQWLRAVKSLQKASEIYDSLWVEYGRANTILFLGNVYRFKGDWEKAKNLYDKALEAHQLMDAKREIGPLLGSLGIVHLMLGNREKAYNFLKESLEMKKSQEYLRGVSVTNIYLGDFYLTENQLESSMNCYQEAMNLADISRSNFHRVESRYKISNCLLIRGNLKEAFDMALKARNLSFKYGYKHLQARATFLLGQIHIKQGADLKGIELLKQSLNYANQYNCYLLSEMIDKVISFLDRSVSKDYRFRVIQQIITYWQKLEHQTLEEENAKLEEITNYIPLISKFQKAVYE